MDNNNVVDVVRELININRDGEKGYQDAAEHAKAAELQSFFRQQGSERGRFATQLESELSRLGEPSKKESGHVTAALHRGCLTVIREQSRAIQAAHDHVKVLRDGRAA